MGIIYIVKVLRLVNQKHEFDVLKLRESLELMVKNRKLRFITKLRSQPFFLKNVGIRFDTKCMGSYTNDCDVSKPFSLQSPTYENSYISKAGI